MDNKSKVESKRKMTPRNDAKGPLMPDLVDFEHSMKLSGGKNEPKQLKNSCDMHANSGILSNKNI